MGWIRWPIGLALALSLVFVPIPWGDSVGGVLGPISFLCEGDWDFDEFPFLYEAVPQGPLLPDAVRTVHPGPSGDRLFSFTGLGVKAVGIPAAAIFASPWWTATTENTALRANLLTGLLCTGLTLLLFFVAARQRVSVGAARIATLLLFFGTTLWPQTRQSLWSNEAALPGLMAVLLLVLRAERGRLDRKGAMLMGAAGGWAVLSRPSMLVLVFPLAMAALFAGSLQRPEGRRGQASVRNDAVPPLDGFLGLCVGALPFVLLFFWDNVQHTGQALVPPFAVVAAGIGERLGQDGSVFSGDGLAGLLGLLFSPSRGLLVFSPFLLLAIPGIRIGLLRRRAWVWAGCLGCLALVLLNAGYADWWGASCWGPRRLLELCPLLLLMGLEPVVIRRTPSVWARRLAAVLILWSIFVQGTGFFLYDSRWDAEHEPTAKLRAGMQGDLRYVEPSEAKRILWSVREGVLIDAWRRLPEAGIPLGWQAEFSLSPGRSLPAPMPTCSVLREVDRYHGEPKVGPAD